MKRITLPLLLATTTLALGACDAQTKGWFGTDDKMKTLDEMSKTDSDLLSVNATLDKQANDALAQGDLRRASQFYEQLLGSEKASEDDKKRYRTALADCLRRMGENEKALAMFDELVKDDPDNLNAQEGRGLTLMALGKSTDAGRVFSDIMGKDSKRWRTLNALGILFVTKNMVPEAMAYYTEALKYSADNPAVLNNVGLSQAVDKNYPRAIQALEQASRVSGSTTRRRQIDLNLALVYATSGDVDTAKDIAGKYLQGPSLDNNLGLYAHLAKDDALAKTYLNMALSNSQTFYERAWNNLDIVDSTGGSDEPTPGTAPAAKPVAKPVVKKAPATP